MKRTRRWYFNHRRRCFERLSNLLTSLFVLWIVSMNLEAVSSFGVISCPAEFSSLQLSLSMKIEQTLKILARPSTVSRAGMRACALVWSIVFDSCKKFPAPSISDDVVVDNDDKDCQDHRHPFRPHIRSARHSGNLDLDCRGHILLSAGGTSYFCCRCINTTTKSYIDPYH